MFRKYYGGCFSGCSFVVKFNGRRGCARFGAEGLCDFQQHGFYRPWQSLGSMSMTGSGCILPGKQILTNAHVVTTTPLFKFGVSITKIYGASFSHWL